MNLITFRPNRNLIVGWFQVTVPSLRSYMLPVVSPDIIHIIIVYLTHVVGPMALVLGRSAWNHKQLV